MNQQEIKEKMTQGTWVVTHDEHIQEDSDTGYFIADCGFKNSDKDLAFKHNPHAIVHAINNTYGKGINPESVPDMYNALQTLHKYLKDIGSNETANTIQDILTKAAL